MIYPQNSNLKTATGKKNKFDMSKTVVTTSDFGVMKPVESIVCVPGDDVKCDFSQFTRLMPMPSPTFGNVESKVRAFFVPFRSCFTDWKEFISNNFSYANGNSTGTTPSCPYVYIKNIINVFISGMALGPAAGSLTGSGLMVATAYSTSAFSSSVPTDLYVKRYANSGSSSPASYYNFKLTPVGRRVYDKLISMHMSTFLTSSSASPISVVCSSAELDSTISYLGDNGFWNNKISVLPLLSLAKLYLDWVVPSRWLSNYSLLQSTLNSSSSVISTICGYTGNKYPKKSPLFQLLRPLYSFYDNDFFTSSWQNAYGEEELSPYQTTIPIPNVNGYEDAEGEINVHADSQFNEVGGNSGSYIPMGSFVDGNEINTPNLNVFGLQTLGALQDMVNRGKLAGSKVQDYLFTTYGIRPSNDALNLSTYLGCKVDNIQIGDVMASAGTDQNALGEYAGKGIGYSNAKFSYQCKEHGMFIVTHEFSVKPSYIDGISPMWDLLDRLDFFQPELDALGVEATPIRYLSTVPNSADITNDTIFGYVPRYTRLKTNFDVVSGDFRVPTLNTGLESWYLARRFDFSDVSLWHEINEEFCHNSADNPLQPLDYIFNDATNDADHFYSVFRFNTVMFRPMFSISDALFNNEHNKLGKDISVNTNGSIS